MDEIGEDLERHARADGERGFTDQLLDMIPDRRRTDQAASVPVRYEDEQADGVAAHRGARRLTERERRGGDFRPL